MNYQGDYKEDATVLITFNTFTSNDPSASSTITNFLNTDVHIHKDDDLTQRNNAAGITVSVNFDGITGSHMIKIDTNDNTVAGFWVTGKDYFVRIEGTTVDAGTINAIVGHFSIENRHNEVDLTHIMGTILTEGAGGRLAAALIKLLDVATPVLVASDVMVGTDGANTTVPDAAGVAATPAEVATALTNINLDHLCKTATAAADMTAEVVDNSILSRILSNGDTSAFVPSTDGFQLIRDRGDSAWTTGAGGSDRLLMVDTTIATLASQTSFTLTAGSADDDAYNNCTIVIEDVSTSTQKAVGIISDYVGATKTITLKYDPAIFAMATTDKVYILAENALKSTLANRQLNVAADGDIAGNIDGSVASVVGHTAQTGDSYAVVNHVDHGNAKLVRATAPANKLDVSATGEAGLDFANIKNAAGAHTLINITVPTVTTNTDMRGTDSAATEAKQDIIDTNVDQIETAVITNATGVDVAADIIAVKAVSDALTSAAAAKLALSAGTIVTGTVSHNNTVASTTVFYCDDITEATADHLNGRLIGFTSGALQNQYTSISDYALVAGEGKFTVVALTEAPADNVTFIIV